MASSALPMTHVKRMSASMACLLSVAILGGCGITSSSEGDSYTSAEAGIVTGVDYLAQSLAVLALEGEGVVTEEKLSPIVENVLLDPSAQSVNGQRRTKAIYGMSSDGAATAINVFVPTATQVNSGIYSESSDLFGCGVLRADRTTQTVTLSDESCPGWILQWNGDDAEQISLERVLDNQGAEPTWKLD